MNRVLFPVPAFENVIRFRLSQFEFVRVFVILTVLAAAAIAAQPAMAATYTWDSSGNGQVLDGPGTWSTSNSNWWNGASDVAWPASGTNAVFGVGNGAAGTINVGNVTANSITFNQPGSGNYLLNGGIITLASSPQIVANSAADIDSTIAGTAGFTSSGPSVLTLGGNNTFTGPLTVSAGTLVIGPGGYVNNGGSYIYVSGSSGANLTLSGGTLKNTNNRSVYVGYTSGPGTINLNAGILSTLYLYDGYNSSGTVNISGGYASDTAFIMGKSGATTNLLNLTGGTLSTGSISGVTTASNTVNFNGGVLQASFPSANFFPALTNTTANIQDGGLLITNNYNDTIAMSLSHSSAATHDGGLTKSGGGILTLSGNNRYNGGTTVSGGVLQVGSASALGSGGLTVNIATVDLNGFGIAVPSLSGTSTSGIVTDNSSGAGTTTFTVKPTGNTTFSGVLANGGTRTLALTVNGPGALTLNGINTYSGPTTISAGTLAVGPAGSLGSGPVTVQSGALLDVSAYNNGGYWMTATTLNAGRTSPNGSADINGPLNLPQGATLAIAGGATAGTLTVNGNLALNGVTLPFTAGGSGNTQVNLINGGTLTLNSTNNIVPTAFPSAGTYTLFTASGGIAGDATNLAMAGPYYSGRQLPSFDASSGTAVTLTLVGSGPANLTWKGTNSNVWDTQTGQSTGTQNWYNQTAGSADVFYVADNVTFDDSTGTNNVSISGTVQPGSVTFSNSSHSYTLGDGVIGGYGSLTINGSGGVTLNCIDSYAGGTILTSKAGLVNLGNAAALGTGPLTLGGGTLANASGGPMTLANDIAQTWSGSFGVSAPNGLNLGTGTISLANSTTVTVTGGTLTVGGAISGTNSNSLTIAGPGTTVLAGSSNYSGGTVISSGLVVNGGTANSAFGALNTSSSAIVIQNGATLDINGQASDFAFNYGLTISGSGNGQGALINSGTNTPYYSPSQQCPNITLGANAAIGGSGDIYMYSTSYGTLDLKGRTLTKTGANTLYLGGGSVFHPMVVTAGTLNISQGTLSDVSNAPDMSAADVVIGPSGTLSLVNGTTIGSLSGSGAVSLTNANSLTVGSGGNPNPGPFAGVISGDSSPLYKSGASSVLTLTGSNTYTGTTYITAGTLQIGNGGNTGTPGTGDITIYGGAMLAFDYGSGGTLTVPNSITSQGAVANVGQGTTILSGDNNYSGGTIVRAGVLQLGSASALGSGTLAVNGGTLDLYGNNASLDTVTMTSGSIGSSVIGGTLSAPAFVLQGGTASAVLADASGSSAPLTVTSGAPVLAASNTYSGGTNILGGGTLTVLAAGALGSGTVAIQPGALLDLSKLSNSYTMSATTLTAGRTSSSGWDIKGSLNLAPSSTLLIAGGASAGTLSVNGALGLTASDTIPWVFGTSSDLVRLTGALTLTGTTYIDPTAAVRQSGTYTLFTCGSVAPSASANLALGGPNAQQGGVSFFVSGGTAVDMQISAANLTWTGSQSTAWDVQTTKNWRNSSGTADYFYQGDNVIFNDSASADRTNVSIGGDSVQPLSVTFGNASKSYTLSGAPIVGSCSLTVSGSGGVTLSSGNSFSGGATLTSSAGVVNLNAAQAVGTGPLCINGGTLNVSSYQSPSSLAVNGGVLNLASYGVADNVPWSICGGTVNANSSLQSPSSVAVSGGVLNLASANALDVGSGSLSISGGTVNANAAQSPGSVTLSNSGRLNLADPAGPGTGTLTFSGGTLANTSGAAMTLSGNNPQTWSGSFTVAATNPLDLGTGAVTVSNSLTLTVPSGSLTVSGPTTLALNDLTYSYLTVSGGGSVTFPSQIAGQIAGGGGLILNGPGLVTLANADPMAPNMYGQVVVNGGTLVAASNGTETLPVGSGGNVTINPGALVSIAGMAAGNPASSNQWLTFNVNGGAVLSLSTTFSNSHGYVFQDTESYAQRVNLNSTNGTAATVNGAAPTADLNGNTVGGGIRMGTTGDYGYINSWGAVPNCWTAELCLGNGSVQATPVTISASNTLTMAGPIDDYPGYAGNPLIIGGPGLVVFAGLNTYGGPTPITGGTLQIGNGGGVGTTGTGSIIGYPNTVLAFNYGSGNTLTVANVVSGSGSVANVGPGTVVFGNSASSYTGGTFVGVGALQVGSSGTPLGSGIVSVAGGVLDLNGYSPSAGTVNLVSGSIIDSVGGGTLNAAGYMMQSGTASANLGGPGAALYKVGTGELVLSGTNTYLGGTTVEGGKLILSNNEAIADGTSLTIGDPSAFMAPVVPMNAAVASPAVAPVPEPGTLALLSAGLLAAGWSTWRRKPRACRKARSTR